MSLAEVPDSTIVYYLRQFDFDQNLIDRNDEIKEFHQKIPEDVNIELNVSCPNAEKKMVTEGLETFLKRSRWGGEQNYLECCMLK